MTRAPVIAWLSDVEGQWDKLASFAGDETLVHLRDDTLTVAEGVTWVFGGDAVDRGDASQRIVRALVDVADRQRDQVVLLAGNRDINKIRLPRELGGFPLAKAPVGLSRPDLLRWIFSHTMGARDAFALRRAELGDATDDDVVDSFLADLAPNGSHLALLRRCRLAHRAGRTLFVHGGIPPESLLWVPDGRVLPDVDTWVTALNAWYDDQIEAFAERPMDDRRWHDLVRYQAPRPGSWHNPESVVYGRNGDRRNNPRLPAPGVRSTLRASGIDRVVVGHTPSGDLPSILRDDDGFELINADPSRARRAEAPRLWVSEEATFVEGRVTTDEGEVRDVAFTLAMGEVGAIGRWTTDGYLIKAPLDRDAFLLFRWGDGYALEQVASPRAAHPPERLRAPEP